MAFVHGFPQQVAHAGTVRGSVRGSPISPLCLLTGRLPMAIPDACPPGTSLGSGFHAVQWHDASGGNP